MVSHKTIAEKVHIIGKMLDKKKTWTYFDSR